MSYDDGGVSNKFQDGMNLGGGQGGDGLGQDTYGGSDPMGQVRQATCSDQLPDLLQHCCRDVYEADRCRALRDTLQLLL